MGVDGVLDLLLAGEVAALGDLADDEGDAVRLLAPVGNHLDGADLSHRVRVAVLILAVVQRLERVEDEEDLLLGVSLVEAVRVSEDVIDQGVLACDEAVLHVETLRDLADLEERFLAGIEEAKVAGGHDRLSELEAHGGLTCARGAGEHHGRGRCHALSADGIIEPLETGLHRPLELGRDLEVEDVGAALPGLETDVQVHVRHGVLFPCWGCRCLTILIYQEVPRLCTAHFRTMWPGRFSSAAIFACSTLSLSAVELVGDAGLEGPEVDKDFEVWPFGVPPNGLDPLPEGLGEDDEVDLIKLKLFDVVHDSSIPLSVVTLHRVGGLFSLTPGPRRRPGHRA